MIPPSQIHPTTHERLFSKIKSLHFWTRLIPWFNQFSLLTLILVVDFFLRWPAEAPPNYTESPSERHNPCVVACTASLEPPPTPPPQPARPAMPGHEAMGRLKPNCCAQNKVSAISPKPAPPPFAKSTTSSGEVFFGGRKVFTKNEYRVKKPKQRKKTQQDACCRFCVASWK